MSSSASSEVSSLITYASSKMSKQSRINLSLRVRGKRCQLRLRHACVAIVKAPSTSKLSYLCFVAGPESTFSARLAAATASSRASSAPVHFPESVICIRLQPETTNVRASSRTCLAGTTSIIRRSSAKPSRCCSSSASSVLCLLYELLIP